MKSKSCGIRPLARRILERVDAHRTSEAIMETEKGHSQDFDLDKTDKLPILVGAMFDAEVADDAIPMPQDESRVNQALRNDYSDDVESPPVLTAVPSPAELGGARTVTPVPSGAGQHDFLRPSPVDLPSLTESMRTVEERIARQQADYDVLSRSFDRARESESAALARVAILEQGAALLRSALEAEQSRVREHERVLRERQAAGESSRTRAEEALLEAERHLSEAKTLKEALGSRDATIAQVLHSLGERDAQLAALQQEHVKVQRILDESRKSQAKSLEDLASAKVKSSDLAQRLDASTEAAMRLGARIQRADMEVNQLRAELGAVRATASAYLEQLRTREFRRGFDENLLRELEVKTGATDAAQVATIAQQARNLKQAETALAEFKQKFANAEAERTRLSLELAERNTSLAEARAAVNGDVQRITHRLESAERGQSDQAAQIARLQSEHAAKITQMQNDHAAKMAQGQGEHLAKITQLQTEQAAQLSALQAQHKASLAELVAQAEEREQEMTVLMAHLHEARKPMEPVEAEIKRLTAELSARSQALEELSAEAQQLRSSLERTRGALEEREFLIRRLERAESNNANVLGRIQTSMERLGSVPLGGEAAGPLAQLEWSAELIRVDGERNVSHALSRRTRIGRASGCELQVDSTSVSRHHALVVTGPRETIIEDLNSTNGVIVNGRKISRASLNDGDMVIVGDVHFRFVAKSTTPAPGSFETPAAAQ
jgi:hypothetical protein